jgi:hypothetical protein
MKGDHCFSSVPLRFRPIGYKLGVFSPGLYTIQQEGLLEVPGLIRLRTFAWNGQSEKKKMVLMARKRGINGKDHVWP